MTPLELTSSIALSHLTRERRMLEAQIERADDYVDTIQLRHRLQYVSAAEDALSALVWGQPLDF